MIDIPTNCPACSSALEYSNDLLYCRNKLCPAKSSKSIEHFAKTLGLKGLGSATIDKLELKTPFEIFYLTFELISSKLSSEKLAEKLMIEIERAREASLNKVLPSLGIPLIGQTATDKLAAVVENVFEIDEDACKKAGLGPKATTSILAWMDDNLYSLTEHLTEENLRFQGNRQDKSETVKGVICLSGKLTSYKTKAEAQTVLESLGFTVKSSLTKDVTILVNEEGRETSKTQKARESGVTIVTNLKTFIGEYI